MRAAIGCWLAIAVALLVPSTAFGVSLLYDGSVFPEQGGWTIAGDPEDPTAYTRTLDDGVLGIEGLAGQSSTVQYRAEAALDSGLIVCEWRSRTSNDHGYSSLVWSLMNPGAWSQVIIGWDAHHATAYFEPEAGVIASSAQMPLTEGYHTYRLVSDGSMHSLFVDGALLLSGALQAPMGLDGQIQFGFGKPGGDVSTMSQWDYIQLTTVPEPWLGVAVLLGTILGKRRCRVRAS